MNICNSNSNYFLLAQIVKSASGKSLREFAEENIFKPLGMVNTGFHADNKAVIKNRATGYSSREGGPFSVETVKSYHVGGNGLFTTVNLARGFKGEAPRVAAVIAIARVALE